MSNRVLQSLSSKICASIVDDLMVAHSQTVGSYRSGDLKGALADAGRFVEHTLRALEYLSSSIVVDSIKSVKQSVVHLEQQKALPDSLRLIVPRVCYMIYSLRSKRNAVHVNEIDPSDIDVVLVVAATNWVLSELVRNFHDSDEGQVKACMLELSKPTIPFIEFFQWRSFR